MIHRLDVFSPESYQRFSESDRTVTGVKPRFRKLASEVRPGDQLLCYVTRLSRWCGILEVTSSSFEDATPRFAPRDDPYTIRFKVSPRVWLLPEQALPIRAQEVWRSLSFTREHDPGSSLWTGLLRTSLVELDSADGVTLVRLLEQQVRTPQTYSLDAADQKALAGRVVRRPEGEIVVTVPDDSASDEEPAPPREVRESIKIQAELTKIGARMGFRVWLPANDKAAVVKELQGDDSALLTELPLNYDSTTLDTIERIDVLWIRRRAIVRAFEVEHTTAIYSGILRMADLLSLQPNMDIRLHIVAPEERKRKVFEEILRPVFSLLDRGPLAKSCTFLSYDAVRELGANPHLAHLSDSILGDLEEEAEG